MSTSKLPKGTPIPRSSVTTPLKSAAAKVPRFQDPGPLVGNDQTQIMDTVKTYAFPLCILGLCGAGAVYFAKRVSDLEHKVHAERRADVRNLTDNDVQLIVQQMGRNGQIETPQTQVFQQQSVAFQQQLLQMQQIQQQSQQNQVMLTEQLKNLMQQQQQLQNMLIQSSNNQQQQQQQSFQGQQFYAQPFQSQPDQQQQQQQYYTNQVYMQPQQTPWSPQ